MSYWDRCDACRELREWDAPRYKGTGLLICPRCQERPPTRVDDGGIKVERDFARTLEGRMTRLTVAERQLRDKTEAEWQADVVQAATMLGYSWAHFRAAQNSRGRWMVPVEGPCGAGFPDLVLFGHGRTIYAELKREKDNTNPVIAQRQAWVHTVIRELGGGECYVWRPSQLEEVIRVLGGES